MNWRNLALWIWDLQVTWDLILTRALWLGLSIDGSGPRMWLRLLSLFFKDYFHTRLELTSGDLRNWYRINTPGLCRVILQLSSCPTSLKSCSLIGCSPASLPHPCWTGTGSGARWVSLQTDDHSEEEREYWLLCFLSQVLSSCRDSERSSSWSAVFIDPLCFHWSNLFFLVSFTNVNWTRGLWRSFQLFIYNFPKH